MKSNAVLCYGSHSNAAAAASRDGPQRGGGGTPGADITERDVMEREMLRSSSDRGDTDVADPGSWGGAGGALLSGHPGEIQNPRKRESLPHISGTEMHAFRKKKLCSLDSHDYELFLC